MLLQTLRMWLGKTLSRQKLNNIEMQQTYRFDKLPRNSKKVDENLLDDTSQGG